MSKLLNEFFIYSAGREIILRADCERITVTLPNKDQVQMKAGDSLVFKELSNSTTESEKR